MPMSTDKNINSVINAEEHVKDELQIEKINKKCVV